MYSFIFQIDPAVASARTSNTTKTIDAAFPHLERATFWERVFFIAFPNFFPHDFLLYFREKRHHFGGDKNINPGLVHALVQVHHVRVYDSFRPLGNHFQSFSLHTIVAGQAAAGCERLSYVHRCQLIFHVFMPSLVSSCSRPSNCKILENHYYSGAVVLIAISDVRMHSYIARKISNSKYKARREQPRQRATECV